MDGWMESINTVLKPTYMLLALVEAALHRADLVLYGRLLLPLLRSTTTTSSTLAWRTARPHAAAAPALVVVRWPHVSLLAGSIDRGMISIFG